MVVIVHVNLPAEPSKVGNEITPNVLIKLPDNSHSSDDVPEEAPVDGQFLRYKWYRIENGQGNPVCCIHTSEKAKSQCIKCVREKIPIAKSYHCTNKCFADTWMYHRALHEKGNSSAFIQKDNKKWYEVGNSKTYIPSFDDIDQVLRFECVVVHSETKSSLGSVQSVSTSRVLPATSQTATSQTPRGLVSIIDSGARISSAPTFSVLSYNILSESHATKDIYSYCEPWALSWSYRRQNLLREIVGYRADIICLQEVQKDHFEEFFKPELDMHGYEALFTWKSTEGCIDKKNIIEGCATFFRNDKFSLIKKHEVDLNDAAQKKRSLERTIEIGQYTIPLKVTKKKAAPDGTVKNNVALILVLEAKFGSQGSNSLKKRQLVCVANTRINVPEKHKDVQLWQVDTLLKEIEAIAIDKIPILICGDFNSIPESAPHELIVKGRVDFNDPKIAAILVKESIDPNDQDVSTVPFGILQQVFHMIHNLKLVSAYCSLAKAIIENRLVQQYWLTFDLKQKEAKLTNAISDATQDYIFYSEDTLAAVAVLEPLARGIVRGCLEIPSARWSSDHIALEAIFSLEFETHGADPIFFIVIHVNHHYFCFCFKKIIFRLF